MASPPAERLQLLYDLGCAFAARIELDELIPLVITKCREVLDAEGASVLLLDPATNELYFPYVAEQDPEAAARLARPALSRRRGIAGAVVRDGPADPGRRRHTPTRASTRGVDRADRRHDAQPALPRRYARARATIGVLQVVNRRGGGPFTDDDLAFLEALAGSVAVAIENARLYERVKASEERLRAQVGALRRDLARRDRFARDRRHRAGDGARCSG